MKQKLLSILALLLMAATGAWADTTVTWTASDLSEIYIDFTDGSAVNNTIKGITATASDGVMGEWDRNSIYNSDGSTTITFTSSVGNIKSIAIKAEDILIYSDPPAGWTLSDDYKKLSWSGEASTSVSLTLQASQGIDNISEIEFTIEPPTTYIVAGNYAEIFEIPWYGTYEANKMTKGDDGKYTKTYNVEDAFSDIQLKVVKDGQDWIGDEMGNNVTFSMKQAGSFTVTLDPNANPVYVTVTGDNVVFANTEYAINYATGMQNGTVTGPDTAKEDDEVTLTITPAAGYVLESISVTGVTTENAVEVTDGKFTMPAEDVNVIATFKSVTYSITVKEGTEDAANWTVSPNPAEAGQTVTISYTGTKKVKSIKAVKKAAASLIVNPEVGQYIGSDGKNYDANATLPDGVTKVAKIFYVGSDNGEAAPYNHGLALALEDVTARKTWCSQKDVTCSGTQYDNSTMLNDLSGIANTDALVNHTGHTHDAASAARGYNSGIHPAGTSVWFLPSAGQWNKMLTAAGSYANLRTNAGLEQYSGYWLSTEGSAERAWDFFPYNGGGWYNELKDNGRQVRACLAF